MVGSSYAGSVTGTDIGGSVIGGSVTASSLRDFLVKRTSPQRARLGKGKSVRGMVAESTQVAHIKYMPEAHRFEANGWQMKNEDVKSRVSSLFNCYTMSDVTFQVDVYHIPAHRFVLASASPIFYRKLYEDDMHLDLGGIHTPLMSESGVESWHNGAPMHGPRHITLPITGVPHLAFFEFLQFIYTDNVHITLDNVLPLIHLAEQYKVAGLNDKCLEFIRAEVVPTSVLRVIAILRSLLQKACFGMWHEILLQGKATRKFRQLTLAERRAKLEELESMSVSTTSRSSRRGSLSSRRSLSRRSRGSRSSRRSSRSSVLSSGTIGNYQSSDTESLAGEGEFGDADDVIDIARGFKGKTFRLQEQFRSQMMDAQIGAFVEEVTRKCWKCVQTNTGPVINSNSMWEQDIRVLREILRLETCSVPEISLFHAASQWAEKKCKGQGMPPTAENKRVALGDDSLVLVRFPVMTPEQFQWEVVPTGLLPYEDVQQLLYGMNRRTMSQSVLGRYNPEPRYNLKLQKELAETCREEGESATTVAAMHTLAQQDRGTSRYNAHPDDPIDSMLAASLLRAFLTRGADEDTSHTSLMQDYEPQGGQANLTLSFGRLPAIQPQPPMTARLSASSPRKVLSRQTSQMIMGQRLDDEVVNGFVVKGGGRASQPTDFYRICAGVYRFRAERLLELWIEEGEVMVKDHGPHPKVDDQELEGAEPAFVRHHLELPDLPPRGRGLPLQSFLCRQ